MCMQLPSLNSLPKVIAALVFFLGVYLAYIFFLRKRAYATDGLERGGGRPASLLVFRLGNGLALRPALCAAGGLDRAH